MNAIAEALKCAVAESRSAAAVRSAFERKFIELQFAQDSESIVVGVPFDAAMKWVRGEMSDLDLILAINGEESAIWWPLLPRLSGYVAGVHAAKKFWNRGARIMVTHTSNEVVRGKCLKHGGRVTFQQDSGDRILVDEQALNHWLGRIQR